MFSNDIGISSREVVLKAEVPAEEKPHFLTNIFQRRHLPSFTVRQSKQKRIRKLIAQCQTEYQQGDYQGVLKLTEKVLRKDKHDYIAQRLHALANIRMGHFDEVNFSDLSDSVDVMERMALPQHQWVQKKLECLDEDQLTTVSKMCELVISSNFEEFKIIFDSIIDQEMALIIPTLLLKIEEFAPALIRDNPRFRMENHGINFVLNILLERYPKLKSSFTFLSDDKNRFLFLPDGIRVIVDYLQNKAALTLKCQVFRNYEELGAFLETLNGESGPLKCTILLRNAHNEERKNHITPIYVEKAGDSWDILITDSIAGTDMAKDCLREIRKVFKTHTSSTSTRHFYVFKTRRQFDGVSCAIFSSRDLVQLSKHPQIMHYVKQVSRDTPSSKRGVVYFDMLPPAFMKVMQDLNGIRAYVTDNNHEERLIHYNKKTSNDETLLENVERNRKAVAVENGDRREINNYIPRKAVKYLGVIIANVIAQNAQL